MIPQLIAFIRDTYQSNEVIPLHAPSFQGNEQRYVSDTLNSTFVSSIGAYVDDFEKKIEQFTQCGKAIATVNGTAALQIALHMAGVRHNDLVITQALTFVATCNAIYHQGAQPLLIDVEPISLSLCPKALHQYLTEHATLTDDGVCIDKTSQRIIRAVVPMHTFGHPAQLDEISEICKIWHLILIEDAAESLGSYYKGQHTGTIGQFAALSFNGNKIITTGGGGMLLARSTQAGQHAKHLTTTAKKPHTYEFFHDEAGFNYRLPNLNAALGCAQMEMLPNYLKLKRHLAASYANFFHESEYEFIKEPNYARSNYWLNTIRCPNQASRNALLEITNQNGIMTRPVWQLMHHLPMYKQVPRGPLKASEKLATQLVNLPSSPVIIAGQADD
ncbi:MAG: LegC family aminotransferase [bacterium]